MGGVGLGWRAENQTKLRLLGVDPSPSLRAILGDLGEGSGMDVDLCTSMSEVRDRLGNGKYDLVVTATDLPDGGYAEVLELIRNHGNMSAVPVLLLVAGRSEETVRNALDRGIAEVFFKRDLDDLVRYLDSFGVSMPAKIAGKTGVLRALVVEDDEALCSYYKELLSSHGFTVDQASSGESALWELGRRSYDFVLVDLVLSGSCSGTQFLRRLRQDGANSSRAIAIAISAYDDEARRLEALRAGANAFMSKPIDEKELAAHIKGMVQYVPKGTGESSDEKPQSQTCNRCLPCQLTPRESNICMLVAMGYSDKRIAEEMGVSYWTVRTHIAHAFKKCQAGNRVELVRRLQGG